MSLLLKFALRGAGWRVEGCASAEAALKLLATASFDVLMVDRTLPGMAGVELVAHLRQRGYDAPIIVVSGFLSAEFAKELMPLGLSSLLEKPFEDLGAVVAAVEQAAASWGRGRGGGERWRPDGEPAGRSNPSSALVVAARDSDRRLLADVAATVMPRVCEASAPRDAVAIATGLRPGIAVIDAPEREAAELSHEIRLASAGTACVVALANAALPALQRLIASGVRGMIDKPVDSVQAVRVLARAVGRDRPSTASGDVSTSSPS